jgi:hypothetical protein
MRLRERLFQNTCGLMASGATTGVYGPLQGFMSIRERVASEPQVPPTRNPLSTHHMRAFWRYSHWILLLLPVW